MPYAVQFKRPLMTLLPQEMQNLLMHLPRGTLLGGSTGLNIALYALGMLDDQMLSNSFYGKKFDFFRFMVNYQRPGILPSEAFYEKEIVEQHILGVDKKTAFKPTVFIQTFSDRFNLSWEGFENEYFLKSSLSVLVDFENNVVLFKDEACFRYTQSCQIYFPNLNILLNDLRTLMQDPAADKNHRAYLEKEINAYFKFAAKQRALDADFSEPDIAALSILFQEDGKQLYTYLNNLFYKFSFSKITSAPEMDECFLENMLRLGDESDIDTEHEEEAVGDGNAQDQQEVIAVDDEADSEEDEALPLQVIYVEPQQNEDEIAIFQQRQEEKKKKEKEEIEVERRQFWAVPYDATYANTGKFYIKQVVNNTPVSREMTEVEKTEFWKQIFSRAQDAFKNTKLTHHTGYEIKYPYAVLKDETADLPYNESVRKKPKFVFKSIVLRSKKITDARGKMTLQESDASTSAQTVSTASPQYFSAYPRSKNRGPKPQNMKAYIEKLKKMKEPVPVINARARTPLEMPFKGVAAFHRGWGDVTTWLVNRKHLLHIDPKLHPDNDVESKKLQAKFFQSLYSKHLKMYQVVADGYGDRLQTKREAENASMHLYLAGGFSLFMAAHTVMNSKEDASVFQVMAAIFVMSAAFIKFFYDASTTQYAHETKLYEFMLNDLLKAYHHTYSENTRRNAEYLKVQLSTIAEILMVMQQLKFRGYDFTQLNDAQYPKKLKQFLLNFLDVVTIPLDPMRRMKSLVSPKAANELVCMTIDTITHLITIHGESLLDLMMDNVVPEIAIPVMSAEAQNRFMEASIKALQDTMCLANQQIAESNQKRIPLKLGTDAIELMDLIALIYVHRKASSTGDNVMARFKSEHHDLANYLDINLAASRKSSLALNNGAYAVDPFHASKVISILIAKDRANSDFSVFLLANLYKLAKVDAPQMDALVKEIATATDPAPDNANVNAGKRVHAKRK